MPTMKPIRIWLIPPGPNPYEITAIKFEDVQKPPYTDINPNGRVPAIYDPNTDITLWESGAIIQYLIERYDTDHKLSYDTLKERHQLNQWLQFQMSGQGPYFGTAAWFNVLHQEKIPSAIERYNNQLKRVLGVLDGWLATRQWLVGDRVTYADLAWVPWNDRIDAVVLCRPEDKFAGFPHVRAWHERMTSRPAWKRCMEARESLMREHGLENATGRPARFKSHQEYEEAIARGENTDA